MTHLELVMLTGFSLGIAFGSIAGCVAFIKRERAFPSRIWWDR